MKKILKTNSTKQTETVSSAQQKRLFFKPTLALQLWGMMMSLVLLTIAFFWIGQILFLERNYAEATLASAMERLKPVMEELTNSDLSEDSEFLPFLSRITNGTLFLVSDDGDLLEIYSSGHVLEQESDDPENHLWEDVLHNKVSENLAKRWPFNMLLEEGGRTIAILMGFPVTYEQSNASLILYNSLDLGSVLHLNRRQLIAMSVFLTLSAAGLAAIFSRHFTKPILTIKDTVDRLADNDFSARASVRRKDELGALSASVGLLGQALSRIDVLRKELIANVSHELRSPLSVIAGYAEMVRDIHWNDKEQREEDLNLIIQEANRMSEMVTDILDYSQLQSGYIQIRTEPCDLCALTEGEITACSARACEYGIRIMFQPAVSPLPVKADSLKMSQVLRNLLYNAINHTPEHGLITVTLNTDGDDFRLSVSNPGEPIPEEDRAIIWERYQRSQHQSGRHMGTGIGLSIVSTILNAHGMTYGVDCENGQTIFWFEGLKLSGDGSE